MRGGGASGQNGQSDQTTNFFWIIALIFGVLLIVWWLFRAVIVTPVFWFRYHEIELIRWLVAAWNEMLLFFHWHTISMPQLSHLQAYMQQANPDKVIVDDFFHVNNMVGNIIRYPLIAILLIAGGLLACFHRSSRYRHEYTMESLRKLELPNWPEITPIMSRDLLKEDLDEGPWAMAQLPLDFCKQHNLVFVKTKDERQVWGIDHGGAYRVFTMQMGQLLTNLEHLPIHIKALFVVFVWRSEKRSKEARALLKQIAASANHGKLNFAGVEAAFQQCKDSKAVKWLRRRHAYVYTFMASLLEIARGDGVVATAEFLWLKPVDRRLWYVLNSVGRQTAVVEVAGPFAHWLAEKRLKKAIRLPMLKQAVLALEIDMENTLHVPEGDKWHCVA